MFIRVGGAALGRCGAHGCRRKAPAATWGSDANTRPCPVPGRIFVGSGFNVLNLIVVAFVLTPVAGLAFAWWSYGVLWG